MAKKTITAPTYDVDNVQNLADQVKGQAAALKATFDKTGADAKTYTTDTLIAELQSETEDDSGANAIGFSDTNQPGIDNVSDSLKSLRTLIAVDEPTFNIYSVLDYGLTGLGIANDATALNTLLTTIGSDEATILFPALMTGEAVYLMSTNVSFPANVNVVFAKGAKLKVSNTFTVTSVNAKLAAGLYQIFDVSIGGSIAGTWNVEEAFAEWFGAVGDNTTNDYTAIDNALDLFKDIKLRQKASYRIETALDITLKKIDGNGSAINAYGVGAFIVSPEFGGEIKDLSINSFDGGGTPNPKADTGILCNGTGASPNAVNRCRFDNIFMSGWDINIDLRYTWDSFINNLRTVACNIGVQLFGQSVNNTIDNSLIVTDGGAGTAGIKTIKDVAIVGEGLMVSNTLIASGNNLVLSTGFLSMHFDNCVLDLCADVACELTNVKDFKLSNSWVFATNYTIRSNNLAVLEQQNGSVKGCTLTTTTGGISVFLGALTKAWNIEGNTINGTNVMVKFETNSESHRCVNNHINQSGAGLPLFLAGTDHVMKDNTGDNTIQYNDANKRNNDDGGLVTHIADAAPVSGTWKRGDRIYRKTLASGGLVGYACVTAGTPGVWKTFGNITA